MMRLKKLLKIKDNIYKILIGSRHLNRSHCYAEYLFKIDRNLERKLYTLYKLCDIYLRDKSFENYLNFCIYFELLIKYI